MGDKNFVVNPGSECLGASLNAVLNSDDVYFLGIGHIACGTRDSRKDSSMGQRHCSVLALCGLGELSDADRKVHSHCRVVRLSLVSRHTSLTL